jgi:hypothetical protein
MTTVYPPIVSMRQVVLFPPGTRMRAKHKHSVVIVIREVSSWHGYDTFVWDESGVHISMIPMYRYEYEGRSGHNGGIQRNIEEDFEVVPEEEDINDNLS